MTEEEDHITSDWKGVNEQASALYPPNENERVMFLWLGCPKCKTKKRFVITESLRGLVFRKAAWISYGSICEGCGFKVKVTLKWGKSDKRWEESKKVVEAIMRDINIET